MDNKILMIANSINPKGGGLTQAVLNRARSFVERGMNAGIITFDNECKSRNTFDELIASGRLIEGVEWINIYEQLRKMRSSGTASFNRRLKQFIKYGLIDNLSIVKLRHSLYKNKGVYRADYHKRHKLTKQKFFHNDGRLQKIVYFNADGNRMSIKKYHDEGFLLSHEHFSARTGKAYKTDRFTSDGFMFLSIFKLEGELKITLFERDGRTKVYSGYDSFRADWMTAFASSLDSRPFYIFDSHETIDISFLVSGKYALKINILHGHPDDDTEPEAAKIRTRLLYKLNTLDTLVVLTKRQKTDTVRKFGNYHNIVVIPNSARPVSVLGTVNKERTRFMLTARFAPQKRVDHALRAIAIVARRYPEVRLHIYSKDEPLPIYSEIIQQEQIADNIVFEGYKDNYSMDMAYAMSTASIISSKYEGLPLNMLESMLNGTPVISYDIRYGPRDVISDSLDGYIVKENDINGLAKRIEELIKDPSKAVEFGQRAKKKIENEYSENKITDDWIRLFEDILTNQTSL